MSSTKPVLYLFELSVWSAAAELALEELGFTGDNHDIIERKRINIIEGENLAPSFLKINPKGTLPTLIEGSNAYTTTEEVISYLLEHAPKVGKTGDHALITTIHEQKYESNFGFIAARDWEEMQAKGEAIVIRFLENRQQVLERNYYTNEEAKPFADFYTTKIEQNRYPLDIYLRRGANESLVKWFENSKTYWTKSIPEAIAIIEFTLQNFSAGNKFIDGDEPGETDFHVGAWLTSTAQRAGSTGVADAPAKLQENTLCEVPEVVVAYLNAWAERDSWKKVYAAGLR